MTSRLAKKNFKKRRKKKERVTSAQKAWTHWPSDDFLKAPVVPPQRAHSATKYGFSQLFMADGPELLDNRSSHNSQYHGPVVSFTLR